MMDALASCWPIHFQYSSATVNRTLTKLDRKQVLNTLYQVCDFQVDLSTKMAALVSNLPIFDFPLNGIGQNLTGNKYSTY